MRLLVYASSLETVESNVFNLNDSLINKVPDFGDYFWSSSQTNLIGIGTARRIQLPQLNSQTQRENPLSSIQVTNHTQRELLPGEGVCGLVAFPFRPDVPGELIIPKILIRKQTSGNHLITLTSDENLELEKALEELENFPKEANSEKQNALHISYPIDEEMWRDNKVKTVKNLINSGDVEKVVLAREIIINAATKISSANVLTKLKEQNSTAMLFHIDGFVGASPELLISRLGDTVKANPLAGTAKRYSNPIDDELSKEELLESIKDAYEHRITIEWFLNELMQFCSYIDADPEPKITTLQHVHHLETEVQGKLSQPAAGALDLVAALHPTPAVAGDPQDKALRIIETIEGFDRGKYAGPVGWVDINGNGEFAVGIRSAQIREQEARLYAGVGLVADSDPESELAETKQKLKTMISAF